MNLLSIILPFISGLFVIFIAPVVSRWINREVTQVKTDLDQSVIIKNYVEALNDAWEQIDKLNAEMKDLRRDKGELEQEKLKLQAQLYRLAQEKKNGI